MWLSTQETYLQSRNELDHLEPDFAEQILDFQENNKNKQSVETQRVPKTTLYQIIYPSWLE